MLCGVLAARAPTLLALDNVERDLDANALLDTLAIVGHTTLLLTSRYPLAPQRLTTITLAPLPAPDAESLFRDQMRRRDASRPNAADEAHIATLAQLVGGLPLAVELVSAYASGQRLSLVTVLKELREKGLAAAYDDPLYPQRARRHLRAVVGDPLAAPAAAFRGPLAAGRVELSARCCVRAGRRY